MSIDRPASSSSSSLRQLSEAHERHRASLLDASDAEARARLALPDPASPEYETSLKALEAELDRSLQSLDRQDHAREQAQAERQLEGSKDDPAPLSEYKRAEAIKQRS